MQTSSPDVKATAYLVSFKTTSDHIAPSKHIHAHVHVSQALPGLCHHPLQVVLSPVIVGKEPITGVEEDPKRWQGLAEARPSQMGHPATVSTPDSHGHTSPRDWGCPCLAHSALCRIVPHRMPCGLASSSSFTATLCSPVLFIQFVLPLELPTLYHTVVPQHQTSRDLLMELCCQVLEK